MKKRITYFYLLLTQIICGQTGMFVNGLDASLLVGENSFISINGDFKNLDCDPVQQVKFNGGLYLSHDFINNDSLKFVAISAANAKKCRIVFYQSFTPFQTTPIIGGSADLKFWEVEINKGTGNFIDIASNVFCLDTLTFISGNVYLNGNKWILKDPVGVPSVVNHPWIKNEHNLSQFLGKFGADTGQVRYSTVYSSSLNINPGNIGISFTGLLNIGSPLTIIRGCAKQLNVAKSGFAKYYEVYSPGYPLVGNGVQAKILSNDNQYAPVGNVSFDSLNLYVSPLTDMDWTPMRSGVMAVTSALPPNMNGVITASMSDIRAPGVNVDSLAFRLTFAIPNCSNPPISALTLDTLHICMGDSSLLDAGNINAVPNTSLRYVWNTVPAKHNRTIFVSPNSTYQKFKLELLDPRGCLTRDSIIIAPIAPFPQIKYFNHINACLGDSIRIKDSVTISSGSYSNLWNFSNNSTSNTLQQNFVKKFQNAGRYSIQLTSTSNYGCTTVMTRTNVLVYALPTASFESSYNCLTSQESFTNLSVSNDSNLVITSNYWQLGGSAGTSTVYSPSPTYTNSSTFNVMLRTTSSFGCRDSLIKPLTIYPRNSSGFSKNNVCNGDTVFFTSAAACNTGSCNLTWQFGDNTSAVTANEKKVYTSEGFYLVKLKVQSLTGCPDSSSSVVFVNPKPQTQFATSATSVCPEEMLYFSNTSSISTGAIVSYSWDYGNQTGFNGYNGSANYTLAGNYLINLNAISDSGCVQNAIVTLSVHPSPTAQYTVANVCEGNASQFISTSTGNNLTHTWNFGPFAISSSASFISYLYAASGNYTTYLMVTSAQSCTSYASASTIVKPVPIAALGGSISTCGDNYLLDANNVGSNYYWLPGNQTSKSIIVNSSGNYQVTITSTNGCSNTESVYLKLNAPVKPRLGADTTVCGQLVLNAGYPGSNFIWNNLQTSQNITANNSGQFIVNVTDLNNCQGADTINLIIKMQPTLTLGPDLNICKPKTGIIVSASTNAPTLNWNNGSTSKTLSVTNSGDYWVNALASNGCEVGDTIRINFKATPNLDLGADKTSCGQLILDAQNVGHQFLWNTGSTTQTLSASNTGNYWLRVTHNISACFAYDTINLIIHPQVTVNLGPDTSICSNNTFILRPLNSGGNFIWTNGSISDSLKVSSSAIYGVTVTNNGGCKSSDYVTVQVTAAPELHFSNPLRYICGDKPLILVNTADASPHWSSHTNLNAFTNTVSITQPGKYWLSLSKNGCTASDTLLIATTNLTVNAIFLASTRDTINQAVQFVNLSEPPPTSQTWFFGDGTSSQLYSPSHVFVSPNDFSVTLEVSNGYCSDRTTKSLNLLFRENKSIQQNKSSLEMLTFLVYPVPAEHEVFVRMEMNTFANISMRLSDLSGRLIMEENMQQKDFLDGKINLSLLCAGVYFIDVSATSEKGNIQKNAKIIKTE